MIFFFFFFFLATFFLREKPIMYNPPKQPKHVNCGVHDTAKPPKHVNCWAYNAPKPPKFVSWAVFNAPEPHKLVNCGAYNAPKTTIMNSSVKSNPNNRRQVLKNYIFEPQHEKMSLLTSASNKTQISLHGSEFSLCTWRSFSSFALRNATS